jgi:serine/threonine protein kinase/WD40 repeat protein
MTPDQSIDEILLLWEEARRRGESPRTEDLCRDCPELLPEVERRIAALQAVYRVLDAGPDGEVRARVEALLRTRDDPGSSPASTYPDGTGAFVPESGTSTAASGNGATVDRVPTPADGTVLAGRYKLIEPIGEGGMGTVWMAEQREPVRRLVAVKLIRAGMDSKAVLARFEAERQALALMDHPNIAKVFDGGTIGGGAARPFFVMELVQGAPLTAYCDRRRLGIPERLALFVQICGAVQHAHQKGIIHRDLKPSNVLVEEHDGKPNPKVIDFGLAKALHGPALVTDRTLQTAFGAGTPLYMAPEQLGVSAPDVDTRADVYALGVVLYELLTGTTPIDRKQMHEAEWDEVRRLIREEEPPRPSARLSHSDALPNIAALRHTEPGRLSHLVRGDLDWIVMKALAKDRDRRYETVSALALDVQRFLHDEPVLAGPPSTAYRLRKFVKRNRARVITAAVFFVLLVAGVIVSTVFGIRASRNEDAAVKARGEADEKAAEANENARQAKTNEDRARAEAERVRNLLHVANMGRAQDALRERRVARARQLLDEIRPAAGETNLCGFEWHYLWNQLHTSRDVAVVHSGLPGSLNWISDRPALAPDGRWTASTKMRPGTVPTSTGGTGPRISQTAEYELRVWDTATGQVIFTRTRVQPIDGHDVALCPAAGLVAWGSTNSVTVYDLAANAEKKVLTLDRPLGNRRQDTRDSPSGPVLLFDPTGARIAALTLVEAEGPPGPTFMSRLEVREVSTGRRVLQIPPTKEWVARSAGFSSDGSRLAVRFIRLGIPQTISRIDLWNLGEEKPHVSLTSLGDVLTTYPFTPDGRWLALIRGRSITLFDAMTGQSGRVYVQSEYPVSTFAFSGDAKTVAVGEPSGTITVFDARGDVIDTLYGHELQVNRLAFRPDGRLVSHARDGLVKEWAPGRYRTPIPEERPFSLFAWDAARRYALTVHQDNWQVPTNPSLRPRYTVWDTVAGAAVLRRPITLAGLNRADTAYPASLAPGGQRVVVSSSARRGLSRPINRYGSPGLIPPAPPVDPGGLARFAWVAAGQEVPVAQTEIVEVATGQQRLVLPLEMSHIGWSADARYVSLHTRVDRGPGDFVSFERAAVWDLAPAAARRVALEAPPGAAEFYWRPADEWFSADGRLFTVFGIAPHKIKAPNGYGDHYLVRWELPTGRLVFARPLADPSANREDRFVLAPHGDRLARLARVDPLPGPGARRPPELELWEIKPDGANARLWSADLQWADFWDVEPVPFAPLRQLEFTPDGRRLVLIGERETRVWDLVRSGPPIILRGNRGAPVALALSPDERRLVMVTASYSRETELRVWDLSNGQELLAAPIPLRMERSVRGGWTAFDGRHLRLIGGTPDELWLLVLDGTPR